MRLQRDPSRGIIFSHVSESQLRLLQQIPVHADPSGSPKAVERLYLDPVRTPEGEIGEEINNDWRELVAPELRALFTGQIDTVLEDLQHVQRQGRREAMQEESWEEEAQDEEDEAGGDAHEVLYRFVVPFDHVEAWYGALNQARLVMQERYQFPEVETLEALMEMFKSENFHPYMISRFYVEIQGALLGLALDPEGEE